MAATWIRKNVYADAAAPDVQNYATGYQVMVERSQQDPSDPTGWTFWAAMHGSYTPPSTPLEDDLWNMCQHGSWFFLSWHRMFVFYFEQMVRAACGDESFALPYWNYSDGWTNGQPPPNAFLPPPFATGGPLYLPDRDPNVNDRTAYLPEGDTAYAGFGQAYGIGDFYRPWDGGFGGGPPTDDPHNDSNYGRLEITPHGAVHMDIGGWMSDPNTAAQDPIFWLHHANIDRLWQGWVQSYANPPSTGWSQQPFSFVDPNGTELTTTIEEFFQSLNDQVEYDELPPPPSEEPVPEAAVSPSPRRVKPHREVAATPPIELAGEPVTVVAPVVEHARQTVAEAVAAPDEAGRVALQLEGIEFDDIPKGPYEVYVNLPEGEQPSFKSPHFAGHLTFFGHAHEGGAHKRQVGNHRYDITEQVAELQRRGSWDDRNVRVTLVPSGPVPTREVEAVQRPAPKVWIRRASVFVQ